MNVLAVEGALGAFSAAIVRNGRIAASRSDAGSVALECGLAAVASVLDEARLVPREITCIAVGIGPGRFTGLRIAIAYAKSLAAAWERPLVALTSFDLLEFGGGFERALAIVLGRPGVISARLRIGSEAFRASGPTADVLDALPLAVDEGPLPVVGAPKDVLHALAERGIIVSSVDPVVMPAASAAALAAQTRMPSASLHEVRADYGELPAAKQPRF